MPATGDTDPTTRQLGRGSLTFVRTKQADAAKLMRRTSVGLGLPSTRPARD